MAVFLRLVAALGTSKKRISVSPLLFFNKMSSTLVPPASVRGMELLDRAMFAKSEELPALILRDCNLAKVMPVVKKYVLKMQRLKPVQDDPEGGGKVAFLNPDLIQEFEDFAESDRKILIDNKLSNVVKRRIDIGYDNWRYDQIFKAVFKEGDEVPNAYSKIGHILHLNLRESQLSRKKLIGEVLLDKISHARTVVNKLNTIDTTYRHFAMEVIAGDNDTLATVTENGCKYRFDFAKVYWNPRLSTEHEILVDFLKEDDVLYDVFAGVGPFAVPAAVRGRKVMANDLNPESFRWLKENVELNKTRGNVTAFNKDGREFLRQDVKEDILRRRRQGDKGVEHIAMNLPAMAAEFLDVFPEMFNSEEAEMVSRISPVVHLYCFVKLGKEEDPCKLARIIVEDKLGRELDPRSLEAIHHVRNVSPNKEMMRVSFRLTRDIIGAEEPANKKLKIDYPHVSSFVDDNVVGKDGKEQAEPQDQKCLQSSRSS